MSDTFQSLSIHVTSTCKHAIFLKKLVHVFLHPNFNKMTFVHTAYLAIKHVSLSRSMVIQTLFKRNNQANKYVLHIIQCKIIYIPLREYWPL